jgi:TolA-binding protein
MHTRTPGALNDTLSWNTIRPLGALPLVAAGVAALPEPLPQPSLQSLLAQLQQTNDMLAQLQQTNRAQQETNRTQQEEIRALRQQLGRRARSPPDDDDDDDDELEQQQRSRARIEDMLAADDVLFDAPASAAATTSR